MRFFLVATMLLSIPTCLRIAAADDFDPHDQDRLFIVRDTSAARNAIDAARALLDKGKIQSALRKLQQVLDDRPDDFYLDESLSRPESVVWRSAADEVRSMLENLDPAARAAYEELATPAVSPLMAEALVRRDPKVLRVVQRRFGASRAGVRAGRLLTEIAYEAGRFHDAAGFARDTLRFAQADGALWALYIDALTAVGDRGALKQLSPPQDVEITTFGETLTVADYIARQRARLGDESSSRDRPMWGGDATRALPFPFDPPEPRSIRWLEYTDWVERNRDRRERYFREEFPHEKFRAMLEKFRPLVPAVEGRVVYVADGRSVRAFDLYSGNTMWRFDASRYGPGESPPFRMYQQGQPAEGRTSLERAFAPVVSGDVVIATVEERLDYYADRLNRIEISMYLPRRRLVALDRHTGAVLWVAGETVSAKLAAIDQWSSIAPPVVSEGLVLTVGSVYRGSHKVAFAAFDIKTGEPRWVRLLGTGQQELNLFGIPVKELAASAVTVADGVAFVSTGLGFVAAVDVRTGAPRWLASYEIIPVKPVEYWYKAPLRLPIAAPNPPLAIDGVPGTQDGRPVKRDLLIVAPPDGPYIYALDRDTGALIWRAPLVPPDVGMDWSVFVHVLGVANDGKRDVLITTDKLLRARDVATGEIVWQSSDERFGQGVVGTGAIAGRKIVVPTPKGLARFSLDKEGREDGELPWPRDAEPGNVIPLDRVLLITGRDTVQWFYDWEDLERDVARRRKEHPDDPSILVEAGELYLRAGGEMERARRAFTEALAIAERSAPEYADRARRGLYRAWRRDGDLHRAVPERATAAYRKALDYAATPEERVILWITLLEVQTGAEERISTLRALVADAGNEQALFDVDEGPVPARAKAALLLAHELHAAGHATEAVDVLQDALRHSGTEMVGPAAVHTHAREAIARIIAQTGPAAYAKYEARARALLERHAFEEVIREYPNSTALPRALLARGAKQASLGDFVGAVDSFRRLLSDYADHAVAVPALAHLARAYRLEGSFGAAGAALTRLARHARDTRIEIDGELTSIKAFVETERAGLPTVERAAPTQGHGHPAYSLRGFAPADDDTNARALELSTERQADGTFLQAPIAVMLHGRSISIIDMRRGAISWHGDTQRSVQRGAYVGGRLIVAVTPELISFDAATGERGWTYDAGGLVRELEVAGGLLFAVIQDSQNLTGTSSLVALDPYTGRRLWSFDLGPENPRRLRGWRDRILLERTRWDARQSIARLMIFDAFVGELQHQIPIPVQTESQPVVADDVFVVAHRKREAKAFKRQLKAYDLVRGVERWRKTLTSDAAVTGIIADGPRIVVLQHDGRIRTFSPDDGEMIAETRVRVAPNMHVRPFMRSKILLDADTVTMLPAVKPSTMQNPSTSSLVSFDRETGAVRWERPFPAGADLTSARISRDGETLVVVASYREGRVPHALVRIVDAETGDIVQDLVPEGVAQTRWVPTSQAGFGTIVVFGKAGAAVLRAANASKR